MKIKCLSDQQLFAEICGFYQQFGEIVKIEIPDFEELQAWIVRTGTDVAPGLIKIHKELLLKNKVFGLGHGSWELTLNHFCTKFFNHGAYILENVGGYKNLDLHTRLEILRALQDTLFERSGALAKFTNSSLDEIREQYLGRDRLGNRYVMSLTGDQKFRIFRSSLNRNPYVVASNRREVFNVIKLLSLRRIPAIGTAQWDEKQLIEFLNVLACSFFN